MWGRNYRVQNVFDRVTAWLRKHGVTARKPLHELRKELGALITSEHGIYAASRVLRHADLVHHCGALHGFENAANNPCGRMVDAGERRSNETSGESEGALMPKRVAKRSARCESNEPSTEAEHRQPGIRGREKVLPSITLPRFFGDPRRGIRLPAHSWRVNPRMQSHTMPSAAFRNLQRVFSIVALIKNSPEKRGAARPSPHNYCG